jgi:hypothetical protein
MFVSHGKFCAVLVLATAVLIGSLGMVCQAPLAAQDRGVAGPKKEADPKRAGPDDKPAAAPKAPPPQKEAPPVPGLKERLRKHEEEVVRIRALMLKEIAEEE